MSKRKKVVLALVASCCTLMIAIPFGTSLAKTKASDIAKEDNTVVINTTIEGQGTSTIVTQGPDVGTFDSADYEFSSKGESAE